MTTRKRLASLVLASIVAGTVAGCAGGQGASAEATSRADASVAPSARPSPRPSAPADAVDIASLPGDFGPVDPGRYLIRPLVPDGPRIDVLFTIPDEGWVEFLPAYKPGSEGRDQTVALHVLNVTNVVSHACTDHAASNPPVGTAPEDLARALAELEPFEVLERPTEFSRWGYDGVKLTLAVPDLPTTIDDDHLRFDGCMVGELKSWIGAPLSYAYYGYSPGLIEELWIFNVGEQRLVVATDRFADSPPDDVEALEAVLDSISIEIAPGDDVDP